MNYEPLRKHIRLVDTRNHGNITSEVLGINIDKFFMPSVANVIGTDLSRYKLISKGLFACNPMHVGRDERLPVALYDKEYPALVSPAYFMFEVIDTSILDPEYLMMWFRRSEFDRVCWLKTDGSVRGGISWEDIGRMEVPVPSIEEQRNIVKAYKTITDRIVLKKQINDNLEAQLKCLFKQSFGDVLMGKKALPMGWIKDEAQNLYEISIGKTPPRERMECFTNNHEDIDWVSISDMGANGMYILDTCEKLTPSAIKEFNVKIVPKDTVIYSFKMTNGRTSITTTDCTTNEAIAHFKSDDIYLTRYAYCYLSCFRFSDLGSTSSITEAVNSKIIKSMDFIIPERKELEFFIQTVKPLFDNIRLNSIELNNLNVLATNYLSLLSR